MKKIAKLPKNTSPSRKMKTESHDLLDLDLVNFPAISTTIASVTKVIDLIRPAPKSLPEYP